jgi:hypothetical protein
MSMGVFKPNLVQIEQMQKFQAILKVAPETAHENFRLKFRFECLKKLPSNDVIMVETSGLVQKLSFLYLFKFAYAGNLAGQRSRSLI